MEPIEVESAVRQGSTFTLVLPLLARSLHTG
jgi:signal transduction histidine kinase